MMKKRIPISVGVCAALSIGMAQAQTPLGADMTDVQPNVAQLNTLVAQADTLRRTDSATKSTRADDTNTRLLTEILNTQIQTLTTLKAIEAKLSVPSR